MHIKPTQQEVQRIHQSGVGSSDWGRNEDVQISPSAGNEEDVHHSTTEWALEKMHRTARQETSEEDAAWGRRVGLGGGMGGWGECGTSK